MPAQVRSARRVRIGVAVLALVTACAACGDNRYRDEAFYAWDGEPALGAYSLDGVPPTSPGIARELAFAKNAGVVVLFYGHDPPVDTASDTVDALLSAADAAGIPTYTFADLADRANHGPGICLSFDDTEVEAWFALRPLLQQHGAHVTFFVTEYTTLTDDARAKLHRLYAEGHSVEAHAVHHDFPEVYVADHGIDAYLTNEVQPSIDVLRADGFTPVAFAYPHGANDEALDDAIAARIRFVRTISGHLKP